MRYASSGAVREGWLPNKALQLTGFAFPKSDKVWQGSSVAFRFRGRQLSADPLGNRKIELRVLNELWQSEPECSYG